MNTRNIRNELVRRGGLFLAGSSQFGLALYIAGLTGAQTEWENWNLTRFQIVMGLGISGVILMEQAFVNHSPQSEEQNSTDGNNKETFMTQSAHWVASHLSKTPIYGWWNRHYHPSNTTETNTSSAQSSASAATEQPDLSHPEASTSSEASASSMENPTEEHPSEEHPSEEHQSSRRRLKRS